MALLSVQFINVDFFRWQGRIPPRRDLRRGVRDVRRSRKHADNPAVGGTQWKKDHLWVDTP